MRLYHYFKSFLMLSNYKYRKPQCTDDYAQIIVTLQTLVRVVVYRRMSSFTNRDHALQEIHARQL